MPALEVVEEIETAPQAARSPAAGPEPRRFLIRGVNWLGDAVMTTPALLRLRERFPDAQITLLSPAKLAELWEHHPAVNNVIVFSPGDAPWRVARRLRAGRFQTALVFPNSPRSAIEVWLARIPQRIGYARPWGSWLLTSALPPPAEGTIKRSVSEIKRLIQSGTESKVGKSAMETAPGVHQIQNYLHLVGAVGANSDPLAPRLEVTTSELNAAGRRFGVLANAEEAENEWVFGLNPGAEYGPAKRWPSERFVAVAAEVQRRTRCRWLIFGSPADAALAEQIRAGIQTQSQSTDSTLNLAGKTSLRELCALLKLCRVLLTNDSGPMHVAAAVGTPVVVPFGSTSSGLTGPGLPGETRHRLLQSGAPCSPCFRRICPIDLRCMTGISTEAVVAAVLQVISQ